MAGNKKTNKKMIFKKLVVLKRTILAIARYIKNTVPKEHRINKYFSLSLTLREINAPKPIPKIT